jgi:hypothetical protein
MQQTHIQLRTSIALILLTVAQAAHPGGSTSVAASEAPVDKEGSPVVHFAVKDFTDVIHEQRTRGLLKAPTEVTRVGVSTVDQLLVRLSSQYATHTESSRFSGAQDLTV